MKRPAGVIVSAVVAILGSLLCLLSGAMTLLVLPTTAAQTPGLPRGFMYVPIAMMLAFGAWGLISAIGLLGLRNWARISTLIFAGVLVTLAVIGVPFLLMMPSMAPPNPQFDEAAMRPVIVTMALFYGAMGLWGAGWLVYFNRAHVKEAFRRGAPEAPPNPNPLSIRIVGWYMLTTAPVMLLLPLMHLPATFGGQTFAGPLASAVYLAYGITFLAAGVGLLKLKRWAHMLAMFMFALTILNVTIFWLQPNARQQMEEANRAYMEAMNVKPGQQQDLGPPLAFGIFAGIFSSALPLYFLVLRREKFLAAADAKAGASRGEPLP